MSVTPTVQRSFHERMEDYALERVPGRAKRSFRDVFTMLFGASTMMLPLLYGAIYAMSFDFWTAHLVMLVSLAVNWLVCYLVAVPAQQEGLTIDLLSRNMLGSRGSVITSAIYGFTDVLFFSFEALFLSAAIVGVLHVAGVGLTLLNLAIALAFVPLVLFGFDLLVKIARIALPLYFVVMIGALIWLFAFSDHAIDLFGYQPKQPVADVWRFAIPFFMGTVVINAVQGADYARFLKTARDAHAVPAGWAPLMLGMPTLGMIFFLATDESQPGAQFAKLFGLFGVILAILSQVKINTNNAYTASLAFSNLVSQAFNWRPGRQVWVVFACLVGWLAIESGTVDKAQTLLDINALVVMAWISIIIADYWIARLLLKLAPARMGLTGIPAVNPIGVPAILAGLGLGWFLPIWDQKWLTATLVALGLYTLGSVLTRGRHLHRESEAEAAAEVARAGAGPEHDVLTRSA
jgi:purine-cytosine permease-like protein